MNKENTKKAIEVMQAYLDGKPIEFKWIGNDEWEDVKDGGPNWLWSNCVYRVKTTPMEIEVWVHDGGKIISTENWIAPPGHWTRKKFREVMDE